MPPPSLPALTALIDAARALPGEREAARLPLPAGPASGRQAAAPSEPELRAHVRGLLDDLADRLEPALHDALARVDRAWDQVDALRVIDARIDDSAGALRHACQRAMAAGDPSLAATATQALWTAEAALALTGVVERRLATFVRLRLRGAHPQVEVCGRPFLDVARALAEAARAW
jgi:hypothetical protein